jgi:hypothetical protein
MCNRSHIGLEAKKIAVMLDEFKECLFQPNIERRLGHTSRTKKSYLSRFINTKAK